MGDQEFVYRIFSHMKMSLEDICYGRNGEKMFLLKNVFFCILQHIHHKA